MGQQEQNIILAKQMYQFGFASDWDSLAAILTEDFRIIEPESLPFGGIYCGQRVMEEVFGKILKTLNPKDVRQISMTANDIEVVSMLELVIENGEQDLIAPVAEYFRVTNGKISEIRPYFFDTAAINTYLGGLSGKE